MVQLKYKKFDNFIKKSLKDCWNIPGLGVVIFNSNDIVYKYIGGYSNLKSKQKLKINDKFCIASCSKSILCTAISSLIDKKKIPNIWNMTLEEVRGKNIHKDFKKVKVKQLAQHNSGIDSPIDPVEDTPCLKKYQQIEDKLSNLNGMDGRKKLTDIVLKKKAMYKPGSKFEYSNWGYGILGAIIEKLTKKHYSEIIDEEIMQPLDINADYEKLYYGKNYVNGYYSLWWDKNTRNKLIPLKKNQYINPLIESPSGETWMNILDCAKYCQIFLKGLNKEETLLKTSTIKNLTKPSFENYGYGWFINKKKHVYHGGNYYHTTTHFHLVPEHNIGIILFTNTNFAPAEKWSIVKEFLKTIN
jgi:CubicO group peptidase (beta-lactamase class C family)